MGFGNADRRGAGEPGHADDAGRRGRHAARLRRSALGNLTGAERERRSGRHCRRAAAGHSATALHRRAGRHPAAARRDGDAGTGRAGRHLGPGHRGAIRCDRGRCRPGHRRGRLARADDQRGQLRHRRAQFRDARRGPVPGRPARHVRGPGRPEQGNDRRDQALRRERLRERAQLDQRHHQRPDAARDGVAGVPGGDRRRCRRGDVLLQPHQHRLLLRKRRHPQRRAARATRLQGIRHLRLGRGAPGLGSAARQRHRAAGQRRRHQHVRPAVDDRGHERHRRGARDGGLPGRARAHRRRVEGRRRQLGARDPDRGEQRRAARRHPVRHPLRPGHARPVRSAATGPGKPAADRLRHRAGDRRAQRHPAEEPRRAAAQPRRPVQWHRRDGPDRDRALHRRWRQRPRDAVRPGAGPLRRARRRRRSPTCGTSPATTSTGRSCRPRR